MDSNSSLAAVLQTIAKASALLSQAEAEWPEAFAVTPMLDSAPEAGAIEDLLQAATHETVTTLAFTQRELETLLARLAVRQRYAVLNRNQFDLIVNNGWSTKLVYQLHQELPSIPLLELATMLKQVSEEWAKLPPLKYKSYR